MVLAHDPSLTLRQALVNVGFCLWAQSAGHLTRGHVNDAYWEHEQDHRSLPWAGVFINE